jgi:hypothetical protein
VLRAAGLRWDGRRRTYLKPARMANGTVVYVAWNETRFAGPAAPGGYPGRAEDYVVYDRVTEERVTLLPLPEEDVTMRYYPLFDQFEVRPAV